MLLFIIGLHLNPRVIKEVGKISLITGLGQILFTTIFGFGISFALGFSLLASLFIAICLTFSSTIIILKLLSDKGNLEAVYGKISIGFLLVQDIAASLILLFVAISADSSGQSISDFAVSMSLKVIAVSLAIFAIARYLLPLIVRYAATSQEVLFIFCIAWGMVISTVFYWLGLSIEIGALLSGVTLSTTSYATEIASRLKPIRDFFILLFFILLGSHIVLSDISAIWLPALILSVFVLVGNPLIVFFLMNLLGFHNRIAFLAGLTVAQISEFSMILSSLAYSIGYLSREQVSLITMVGIITITVSSYMIMYSYQLYNLLSPLLKLFAIRKNKTELKSRRSGVEVIVVGFGRTGKQYLDLLDQLGLKSLIVDFNPSVIDDLESENANYLFGDAADADFWDDLPLESVKLVISTVNDFETDSLLCKHLRRRNQEAMLILKSNLITQAQELYESGASYVIMPEYLGATHALKTLTKYGLDASKYVRLKNNHLKYLESFAAVS